MSVPGETGCVERLRVLEERITRLEEQIEQMRRRLYAVEVRINHM